MGRSCRTEGLDPWQHVKSVVVDVRHGNESGRRRIVAPMADRRSTTRNGHGGHPSGGRGGTFAAGREAVRLAFEELLSVPTAIVAGFMLLAVVASILDRSEIGWLAPLRTGLQARIFGTAQATADLLGTVSGNVITVTSIKISLVLLAVQQAAGSLTSEVIDQFPRRRLNQVTFGFFVGLAVYALLILSTVDQPYNPVLGAAAVLLLAIVGLYLLLVLLYTTINQMRPAQIIEAIHGHILAGRERQRGLLRATRRAPRYDGGGRAQVVAPHHGFVVGVDVEAIGAVARRASDEVEIILHVVEDSVRRILSGLGDHVLTADLDAALGALLDAMTAAGKHETADAVRSARVAFGPSVGTLNSRATRVPGVG